MRAIDWSEGEPIPVEHDRGLSEDDLNEAGWESVRLADSEVSDEMRELADRQGSPSDLRADLVDDTADFSTEQHFKNFELDETAIEAASRVGVNVAESLETPRWGETEERLEFVRVVEREVSKELGTPIAPALIAELPPGVDGLTDRGAMEISAERLLDKSPDEMLATLAHEYRHRWQMNVIDGDLAHPNGRSGRAMLALAEIRYAEMLADWDGRAYASNVLELDAETFARRVVESYNHRIRMQ